MTRRLVIAGCLVATLAGAAGAASASTGSPDHRPNQELCLVLGGTNTQDFCVNWDAVTQKH